MSRDDWSVAVLLCNADKTRSIIMDFYFFVRDLDGVKNLHFLIRDRIEHEVVVMFRVLLESKHRRVIRSKIAFKLKTLLSENKFAVDPNRGNPLEKYVAWSPEERIAESGPEKFALFCNLLSRLSGVVVDMVKEDYFGSAERVELAHLASWMLGCTEYGLMSPAHWEVGYYDRVEDKACPFLKQNFPKARGTRT